VVDLDDIERIAELLIRHAAPIEAVLTHAGAWVMAQLTDDCFALSVASGGGGRVQ